MRHFVKTLICCIAALAVATAAHAALHQAAGDFDGDGVMDSARLEATSGGAVLFLALSNGKVSRTTLSKLDINGAAIETAVRGTEYTDACLRGVGKACADTDTTRLVLENDGVAVHQTEASSTLYYLKGSAIKSLTVSD